MTTCYFLQIKIAITVHLIYNKSNFSFSSKKRHSQDLTSPLKFEIRLSPLLIFPKKIDRERERGASHDREPPPLFLPRLLLQVFLRKRSAQASRSGIPSPPRASLHRRKVSLHHPFDLLLSFPSSSSSSSIDPFGKKARGAKKKLNRGPRWIRGGERSV